MSEGLTIDIGHLLSNEETADFVPVPEFNGLLEQHAAAFGAFQTSLVEGTCPIALSFTTAETLPRIKEIVHHWRHKGYRSVLVIGIGGSTLGFRALMQAARGPYANLWSARGGWPTVFVLDNIDPAVTTQVEELIDIRKTALIYISKSGETAESAANFLHFYRRYREAGGDSKDVVFICDGRDNAMNRVGRQLECHVLHIPEKLGGRFSVVSPVGFMPGAAVGLVGEELLAGADRAHLAIINTPLERNPVYSLALCLDALCRRGKTIHVLFSYSTLLTDFGLWFEQLWAESLGKERDLQGNVVHAGTTPLPAVGATDQHSLVQLFREGPGDKVYGFVNVAQPRGKVELPNEFPGEVDYTYLGGHTMAEQLAAEQVATEMTLVQGNRPCYRITLPDLSVRTMGSLFYFMEALTVFTGALWNVDPFGQPGVQAAKDITYALMGRKDKDYLARRPKDEADLAEFERRRRRLPL